jgi:hypothetical protein
MLTRRQMLKTTSTLAVGGGLLGAARRLAAAEASAAGAHAAHSASQGTGPPAPAPRGRGYTPVVTPNGSTLPWKMVNGV